MYSRDVAEWMEYKIFNFPQNKPYLKFISKNYLSNRITFFLKFLYNFLQEDSQIFIHFLY